MMLRRIWYSKKYKVNFLGIPKCGVTTVCKALEIDIDRDWIPIRRILIEGIPGNIGAQFSHYEYNVTNDFKTFTILRHPVARLLSGWQECIRRGTYGPQVIKVPFEKSFEPFVNEILDRGFFDEHIEPMSKYFIPELVDKVFILEKHKDGRSGMLNFCRWQSIDHLMVIPQNQSEPYDKTVSLKTLHKIEELYKEDFELYREWQ